MKAKETQAKKAVKLARSKGKTPTRKVKTKSLEKRGNFQRAIESASIVSMANKKGDITYVNDNFVAISGYSREELLGHNHRIINSGFHSKSFWVGMWKAIASGKTWRAEVKNKAKNGSYYWVDTFVMPFLDEDGNVREFLSIRNDITQRKAQEERIVQLNHSLSDFQNAIQGSSIVSMANPKGDITYVNDNFVAISGYSRKELLGQNHRIINSGFHPKSFWVNMWKTIASGKTWRAEVKNKAKDGSYYWVDTFVMPFLDENGNIQEFLSIRNDITERKQSEEDLITANERLRETLRVSHMGTAELDVQTRQLLVSEELARLLEIDTASSFEISIEVFVHKYIAKEDQDNIYKAISEGQLMDGQMQKRITVEFDVITERGSIKNIEATGMFRSDGKAFGILQDVTDRKRLENERTLSQIESISKGRQIERILYSITDGFFAIDKSLRLTLVNPVFANLAKMEISNMVGKKLEELWPGIAETPLVKKYVEAMKDGEPFTLQIENETVPGQHFQVHAYPNLEGLFVYYRDISEEVNVRELASSKAQQMKEVIDSLKDGFLIISKDWKILEVNQKAEAIVGVSREKLHGSNLWECFPTLPDAVISRLRQTLENGMRQTMQVPSKANPGKMYEINILPAQNGLMILLEDVSESIHINKKLKEEELKLAGLVNNLPDAAIYQFANNLNDGRAYYTFLSGAIERITGFSSSEIVENPTLLDDRIHPEDIESHRMKVSSAIASATPLHSLFRQRHKNNEYRWLEVRSVPREAEKGILIFDGIISDVTDRIRTREELTERESTLEQSRQQMQTIMDNAPMVVFLKDKEGRYRFFNQAYREAIPNVQIGCTDNEIFDEHFAKECIDRDQEVLSGKTIEFEHRLPIGGAMRTYWETKFPILDEQGKAYAVGGVSLDISEFLRLRDSVKLKEEQLQVLANNIPNGIIYRYKSDKEGRIESFPYVSDGAEGMYGIPASEIMADATKAFEAVHPDDLAEMMRRSEKSRAEGTQFDFQYRMIRPDGQQIWVHTRAKPTRQSDGSTIWDGLSTDITDFKKIQEQLVKSQTDLEALLNASNDVTFFLNRDCIIQIANEAGKRFITTVLGIEPQAGDDFRRFIPPSMQVNFLDNFNCALRGEIVEVDRELAFSSDITIWAHIRYLPVRNSMDEIIGVSFNGTDVSERRKAEELFRKKDGQLRFATMMANMGDWELDLETMIPFWSNEVCRIHEVPIGYKPDLEKAIEFYGAESRPIISEAVKRCIETGETYDLELEIVTAKGNRKSVRTIGISERRDGKTVKLYGLFQDITQQKSLQRELERLALIVRNTDNLVVMTDPERRIVWVNESFENITEYRLEEVKGRKPSEFLQGPETDLAVNDRVRSELESRQSARFEIVNYSKSGRKYWLDIEIQPLFDEQGTLMNYIALELDITERKLAEEQIRKKEEQIRLLTNNLPDNAVIFQRVLNPDGSIRSSYFSSGIEELVGVSVQEAQENPEYLVPFVVEQDRDEMRRRVLSTLQRREFLDFEVRIIHSQRGLRWLHFFLRPITQDDGGCIWNGIISDVTERKMSEELLKKSEEQIRFVTDNLPDHAVIYQRALNRDFSMRSAYFSSGIEALLGVKKEEAEKDMNYLTPFVVPESQENFIRTLGSAKEGHQVMDFEVQVKTTNGQLKWIRIHSSPFELHDGGTVWNGMLTDITERKEVEEKLRFTSFTIDHTQDIILWIRKDSSILDTNPAALGQLGMSEEEIKKSSIPDFDLHYTRDVWDGHWVELRQKGSMTFESRYRRKDGSIFFVEINANLVKYRGEEFNVAIVRDITERKKLERKMRESEERIQNIARNLPNGSIYQFLMRPDGSFSFPYISEGIDKLVGVPSEVLLNDASRILSILHPDDAPVFQHTVEQSASTLSDFHLTIRVKGTEGKYHWLAAHSKPRKLEDNSILWDGVMLDETERNETQQEFIKSQMRLQSIFDNAINAMILADVYGNYLDGNQAACRMLGYQHSELVKLNVAQVVLPETLKMDPYNRFLREGHQTGVIDLRTKDGKIITTRYNAVASILPGLHLSIMEDITERRQIEKAMAENERRLNSISQNIPSGSIYQLALTPGGEMQMLYFSDGLAYELGTTGQAIMDNIAALNSRCHPDDVSLVQSAVEESARTLSDFRQRVGRFADNAGNYHHLGWYSHPSRLDDGTIIWDGVVMDETEEYEKEMALVESEEQFRGLVNDINIGIILQGPNAEMLLSNQAARELLGVTEDQLMGRSSFSPDWNVIHEDGSDFPGREHPVPVAIQTGKPVRDVVMGVNNPFRQQRVWLQVDAIPRLTKEGKVKNVICTFNDISKLKKSEVQLKESAERLVLATRAASIGVWEWNLVTNDLIWDENMFLITGFEEGTVVNYQKFRAGIHPEDTDFVEENVQNAIEGRAEFNTLFRYINQKDKSIHYFQGFGTVQRDELGKPLRMIGVDYDVTEQIENEQRLQESEERLLKSLHDKEMLIKEIHHRIKNNLQLISSMLYIRMASMEHGEIRSFLEETRQKIRSIAIIHERLLQTGEINMVDISDYLGKLIVDLQMTASVEVTNINIETEIDPINLPLDVAINCGLILNEVLTNAFKHAFAGRSAGRIEVKLKKAEGGLLFTIQDDGIGLPENLRPGAGGFGMLMLEVFFNQLRAKVEILRSHGTGFLISFSTETKGDTL